MARRASHQNSPRHAPRLAAETPLAPLVLGLSERFAAAEADWAELADPRLLRRFRRILADMETLLAESPSSEGDADRIRSACAELLVAERLLRAGCAIEHEAETPAGRRADFRARRSGAELCVHVKRAPRPTLRDASIAIPQSWRTLETVRRPLVVALSLSRNLRGRALHAALDEAFQFVEQASVGDELLLRDGEGLPAARLRALAPSPGSTIELVADLSTAFDDHVPRFQHTLRKAFAQFMPRVENLIVVAGSPGAFEAFTTALLGSHIERWDKRPRVGELIAYGRGGDGFWAGSMRNQSRLAAYWPLERDAQPLLFVREPSPRAASAVRASQLAREVFA
ncbi:MAG: hypothetical protein GC172_12150 [Phycisphaera sp.]|nr:hypothetical protein [Phycisphaera sp.]